MSDHLPECIYAPPNVDPDKGIEWGGLPCICDRLRACEQRVRANERERSHAIVDCFDMYIGDREAMHDWINGTPPDWWTEQPNV